MSLDTYIQGVLIGVDDAAAAVLFSATPNDITISARCGMALMDQANGVYDPSGPHGLEAWALNALAAGLDDLQKSHCTGAILGDRDRAVNVLSVLLPYTALLTKD